MQKLVQGPLLAKLGNTLDSLSVTVAGVNAMLSESNQAAVSSTLAHLEKTMKSVNGIASAIDGKSAELTALVDNLAALSAKFGSIADKADGAMDGVSSIVTKIDASDIAARLCTSAG